MHFKKSQEWMFVCVCGGREWFLCICLKSKNVINTEKKTKTILLYLAFSLRKWEAYFKSIFFFRSAHLGFLFNVQVVFSGCENAGRLAEMGREALLQGIWQ